MKNDPVLGWYHPFLDYQSHIYTKDFNFFTTNMLWVFDGIFLFQYHTSIYNIQEPSYLARIAIESIWFRMVLT